MHKQSETGLYTAEAIFSALQNLSHGEKQKFISLVNNSPLKKPSTNHTKNGKTEEQTAETQIFIQNDTGF